MNGGGSVVCYFFLRSFTFARSPFTNRISLAIIFSRCVLFSVKVLYFSNTRLSSLITWSKWSINSKPRHAIEADIEVSISQPLNLEKVMAEDVASTPRGLKSSGTLLQKTLGFLNIRVFIWEVAERSQWELILRSQNSILYNAGGLWGCR